MLTACTNRTPADASPTPTAVARLQVDADGMLVVDNTEAPTATATLSESSATTREEAPTDTIDSTAAESENETAEPTSDAQESASETQLASETPAMVTEQVSGTVEVATMEVAATATPTATAAGTEIQSVTVTQAIPEPPTEEADSSTPTETTAATETPSVTAITETPEDEVEAEQVSTTETPIVTVTTPTTSPETTATEAPQPTSTAEQTPTITPTTTTQASSQATTPALGGMSMGMGAGGGMGPGSNTRLFHSVPIPTEYAGKVSPTEADATSLAQGQQSFNLYCATCHGESGMGDGPAGVALDPAPPAIAMTSQMLGDDYLLWRISEGGAMDPFNSAMPTWKGVLSEDQRWDVINYVRSLGADMPDMPGTMGTAQSGANADAEAAMRAEMLSAATDQDLITQDEADTFDTVHQDITAAIAADPNRQFTGNMRELQDQILSELVADGTVSAEDADIYNNVHLILEQSGLMP